MTRHDKYLTCYFQNAVSREQLFITYTPSLFQDALTWQQTKLFIRNCSWALLSKCTQDSHTVLTQEQRWHFLSPGWVAEVVWVCVSHVPGTGSGTEGCWIHADMPPPGRIPPSTSQASPVSRRPGSHVSLAYFLSLVRPGLDIWSWSESHQQAHDQTVLVGLFSVLFCWGFFSLCGFICMISTIKLNMFTFWFQKAGKVRCSLKFNYRPWSMIKTHDFRKYVACGFFFFLF